MRTTRLKCDFCEEFFEKLTSLYNHGLKMGYKNNFCSKEHQLAHLHKTKEERDFGNDYVNRSIANFWGKVNKTTGLGPAGDCWEYPPAKNMRYGTFQHYKKHYRAHRFSFWLTNGDFDETLYVCHKCDNTKCVNSSHLFLGTQKDNMEDMAKKKRGTLGSKLLSIYDLHALHALYKTGLYSYRDLAKLFEISSSTVKYQLRKELPVAC